MSSVFGGGWPKNEVSDSSYLSLLLGHCATVTLAGCAGSPSVKGFDTVSVQIYSGSDFYLDLEKGVAADRSKAPGDIAVDASSELIRDCGSLVSGESAGFGAVLAPFCVLSGVAIGTIAGAIAQGVKNETTNADVDLTQVVNTANNDRTAEMWRAILQSSLEEAGRQQNKTVVPFPGGEPVYVVVENLSWARERGGHWAIAGKFRVAAHDGDGFATKNFTTSSEKFVIEDWLADDGKLVPSEMRLFFDRAAIRVWGIVTQ